MRFRAKVLSPAMVVDFVELDASNEDEARRFIETSGASVLGLQKTVTPWRGAARGRTINLAVFNQQLNALLDAGQPIVDAIAVLGRKEGKGRQHPVYDTLLKALQQGKQLSEAMDLVPSVFPSLYVAMVRSSETTGTVRTSITRYMHYQSQVDEIRRKLIAAAIYPAILISVAFMVVSFLMLYVLPRFSLVFEDASARKNVDPGFVQLWGNFVNEHTLVAYSLFFGVLAGAAILAFSKRVRIVVGRRLLHAPFIGEKIWTLQLSRMYRTVGMLLRSGVSVLAAMRMTSGTLPLAMRPSLDAACLAVSEGIPISQVMGKTGLSTEVSQQLLAAGESSGNLDDMMERIADFYDQEMALWIDTTGRLVEPILMVGIGLVIGVIVLMLYSPIFDMTSAF